MTEDTTPRHDVTQDDSTLNPCYIIGNIPSQFRSADLRAYFSQFTEKKGFKCFHYRHRPHVAIATADGSQDPNQTNYCCCIVRVDANMVDEFLHLYNNQTWESASGELVEGLVKIHLVEEDSLKTLGGGQQVKMADVSSLPELNPPHVMPQGNVGTPLTTFMDLIRTCKLPSHLIKKLQLKFPNSRSGKKYGAVPFEYESQQPFSKDNRLSLSELETKKAKRKHLDSSQHNYVPSSTTLTTDDEHDAEDWERFESLHDDVDKQGRTKERLFEEEQEVVWEKGGSGLVFHTDAAYWRSLEEEDFDEETADDKDIDMGIYYGHSEVELDRDARQLLEMSREQRLRKGDSVKGIGAFEQHTKGFGGNVMKQSGWRKGHGIGRGMTGVSEPIEVEGQSPYCKKGLGLAYIYYL